MMIKLIVAAVILGSIELFTLSRIMMTTGPGVTLVILLAVGVIGGWLARRQGTHAIQRIRHDLDSGVEPAQPLVNGALVLLAGILLALPGFISDALALILLIPTVRGVVANEILRMARKRMASRFANAPFQATLFTTYGAPRPPSSPDRGDVIDLEGEEIVVHPNLPELGRGR
jgi:UPF0716 protein FxsA